MAQKIKSLPRESLNLDPQQLHKERGVTLSVLKNPVLEMGVAEMGGPSCSVRDPVSMESVRVIEQDPHTPHRCACPSPSPQHTRAHTTHTN